MLTVFNNASPLPQWHVANALSRVVPGHNTIFVDDKDPLRHGFQLA